MHINSSRQFRVRKDSSWYSDHLRIDAQSEAFQRGVILPVQITDFELDVSLPDILWLNQYNLDRSYFAGKFNHSGSLITV